MSRRIEGFKPAGRKTRIAAVRRRYEGSAPQELLRRLAALDFSNWIVLFGAALLLAVLPLLILLSSLAAERIDDDLSRHIGLNSRGAHIIQGLFRRSPSHATAPVILGLIFALAGTVTVARSLQVLYAQVFEQEDRGWRDLPRLVVWVAVLLALLIAEGSYDTPLRAAAGPVVRAVVSLAVVTLFFGWTMSFLLAGVVRWRRLIRPAFVTGLLWLGLALFSSLYFSTAIVSEHRLYGVLGVVFVLLTWFIAIGAIILLGAACGAVWQERRERGSRP